MAVIDLKWWGGILLYYALSPFHEPPYRRYSSLLGLLPSVETVTLPDHEYITSFPRASLKTENCEGRKVQTYCQAYSFPCPVDAISRLLSYRSNIDTTSRLPTILPCLSLRTPTPASQQHHGRYWLILAHEFKTLCRSLGIGSRRPC